MDDPVMELYIAFGIAVSAGVAVLNLLFAI
jgi:hypothetical protein